MQGIEETLYFRHIALAPLVAHSTGSVYPGWLE